MPAGLRFLSQRWFQVLAGGVVLFILSEQGLQLTGNLNLIPTVILVGAFVVPMTFVTYFFSAERSIDRERHGELSLPLLAASFFIGGAIGVVAAGVVEYSALNTLSISTIFGVAVIEEMAKLVFPLIIFFASVRYRSQADGLLFGVAAGMGFAALETMGYGMVAFIRSQGSITVLEQVLLVRGLLSPVGHAAWTGFACSVLWGARQRSGRAFAPVFFLAVAGSIVLHALWDLAGTASSLAVNFAGYAVVGTVSLSLILGQLSSARHLNAIGLRKAGSGIGTDRSSAGGIK
jgi:protease PrsW